MDHTTSATALLATSVTSSLLPLTRSLLPGISQVARQIVAFRATVPTPAACHTFETQLHDAECMVGW